MYLPIVHYPKSYEKILAGEPRLPNKPIAPTPPKSPEEFKAKSSDNGCQMILFIPSILVLMYALSNTKVLLPAIVLFLVSLFLLFTSKWDNESSDQKYEEQKSLHPSLMRKYQLELEAYNKLIDEYETNCLIMTSPQFAVDYRSTVFKSDFKVKKLPTSAEKFVKTGVSESFFHVYLVKQFGNNVLVNQVLETSKGSFYPDFVIVDRANQLYIDVEIDEPYVGSTGDPIHHETSNDYKRNEIFTELNWLVIRFAEEQIIKQPQECCQFILSVMQQFPLLKKEDGSSSGVQQLNVWSHAEANRMAFRKYRHSYLPYDLQDKLHYETFEEGGHLFDEKISDWKTRSPSDPNLFGDDDLPF